MTNLQASYGSPHIGKIGHADPDNEMRKIIQDNPSLRHSQTKASKALIDEALGRLGEYTPSDLLMAMLQSEATRSFWRVTTKIQAPKEPEEKEEAAARAVIVKRASVQSYSNIVTTVFSLTFGEVGKLAKSAPKLAKLAKMGRPNQNVSDVLTLAQLKKLI